MADLKMLATLYKKGVSSRPWETRAKHAKQRKIQLKSRPGLLASLLISRV